MKHPYVIFLIFTYFAALGKVLADQKAGADIFVCINHSGIKLLMPDKSSDFFSAILQSSADEGPSVERASSAELEPYLVEVNGARYAICEKGLISCANGEIRKQGTAAWSVLKEILQSQAKQMKWGEQYREFIAAFEAHPLVNKSSDATIKKGETKGIYVRYFREEIFCECGAQLNAYVRSVVKTKPTDVSAELHIFRKTLLELWIDGQRYAWADDGSLVNWDTGARFADRKTIGRALGILYNKRDSCWPNETGALIIGLRAVEQEFAHK